jgi:hypothetical protein
VVFDETQFPFLSAETAARPTIQSELVPDSDGAVIIQGCHHPTPPSPNMTSTLNAVGSATLSPNPSSSSPATHNSPDSTQAATSASSPATAPAAPTGHPMQTRSRAGIYKPNPKYALTSELPPSHQFPSQSVLLFKIRIGELPWPPSSTHCNVTTLGVWLIDHQVLMSLLANGSSNINFIQMALSNDTKLAG